MTSKSAVLAASFHSCGYRRSVRPSASSASASTSVGRRDGIPARGVGERDLELVEDGAEPSRRDGARRCERRLDVVVRGLGAVAERDCLLDLEVERHASVLHASSVLDRDESHEALELARVADELLAHERRGAEARERALDTRERSLLRGAPAAEAAAIDLEGGA